MVNNCGVYRIINNRTGRFYIGASANIRQRFSTHRSHLRTGRHCNTGMLKDFQAHGLTSFEFEITELCEPEALEQLETQYLELHIGSEECYNRSLATSHPAAETCNKISEALTGRPHTSEQRRKMSRSHAGKTLSDEHKANIGKALSQPVLAKDPNGDLIIYPSRIEAAADLGVSQITLRKWLRGSTTPRRKYKGWEFSEKK